MASSFGPPSAPTDLYDERRHVFLVQYPPGFVVLFGVLGLVAVALTGFLGYASGSPAHYAGGADWLFSEPWPLFAWLCTLIFVLEGSVLRDPALQRRRTQTYAATGIAIALVIVLYYWRRIFSGVSAINLFAILHLNNVHLDVAQGVIFAIINYGILALFGVASVRRWVRRARGTDIVNQTQATVAPSLAELVAGDLFAGAALAAVLWGVFHPATLQFIANAQASQPWAANLPSISTTRCATDCSLVDRNQMLIYASLALVILALTALVNGLAAANAVNRTALPHRLITSPDETGSEKEAEGVVETVFDTLLAATLLSAVNRQRTNITKSTTFALQGVVWPVLIVLAVVGVGVTARFAQGYLHGLSCVHGGICDPRGTVPHDWLSLGSYGGLALVGLAVAGVSIAGALGLALTSGRVARNTLNYLGLVGLLFLLTLWIFSLALYGFNIIVSPSVLHITGRLPFAQFEPLSVLSFAALVVYANLVLARRTRRGDASVSLPLARIVPGRGATPALPPPGDTAAPPVVRGYERDPITEAP